MVRTVTKLCNSNTIRYPSISIANSKNWTNPPTKKSIAKEKKNLFFEECLAIYDKEDPFWIRKLNEAILGKFPRHFRYYKETRTLIYSYNKKKDSIKLDPKAELAVTQFIEFVQTHGCIYSAKDQIKEKISNDEINWSKTRDNVKMNLIEAYAIRFYRENSLKYEDYLKIKNDINLGILMDYIKAEDVEIENNLIKKIEGIKWDRQQRRILFKSKPQPKIKKDNRTFKKYHLGIGINLNEIYNRGLNIKSRSEAFVKSFLKGKKPIDVQN